MTAFFSFASEFSTRFLFVFVFAYLDLIESNICAYDAIWFYGFYKILREFFLSYSFIYLFIYFFTFRFYAILSISTFNNNNIWATYGCSSHSIEIIHIRLIPLSPSSDIQPQSNFRGSEWSNVSNFEKLAVNQSACHNFLKLK